MATLSPQTTEPTAEQIAATDLQFGLNSGETPECEIVPECAPLDTEKVYHSSDYLTLATEEGDRTLKVGVWVYMDPVRLHKLIVREKTLHVDEIEVLSPLTSKLRRADPEYYKRFMGLKLVVDYPGYSTGIMAKIPFETDPVGFYKWWRKGKHEDKVHLNLPNQIRLFQKVSMMDKKVMLKKDLELL